MICEQVHNQMEEDSKKMQQAIADYNTFIFWATEVRGLTLEAANYCWRHRYE